MSIPSPKHALFVHFASVAKALGHPLRLELVEHLAQGARTVDALSAKLNVPIANVSQHLQAMRRAGLVDSQREGKFVSYQLSDNSVLHAFSAIRAIAERRSAEVERIIRTWFDQHDDVEPVSHEELASRIQDDLVTIIDVRPADEYALGHIPEAINLPMTELENHLSRLPRDREIVAYCRGPWCVMSFEAVFRLRQHGFAARRLEDGLPEWKASGRTIEID